MSLSRDDFEQWLFEMDDQIELFLKRFPCGIAHDLDFTIGSLSKIEHWLISKYPSIKSALLPDEKDTLDQTSRYVGETLRKSVGGIWNIDIKNKKNAFFCIPVVETKGVWSACPVTLVTAAIDRRKGNYIEEVVTFYVEQYGRKVKK